MGIYKEEKVNLITILICWLSIVLLSISLHFNRNSNNDSIALFASGSIMFMIPSVMYLIKSSNSFIKYTIVINTILLVYFNLYLQEGVFDNIFYLIISIVVTAGYFDPKFTIYTTISCMVSSWVLYFGFKSSFFTIYRMDNFLSLQLALALIGLIISIQTYWSNKLVQSQKELYNKAVRDKLTYLYNRTFFDEFFSNIVNQYKKYNKDLSIIVIDVDDFKHINDTFGHTKGDLVLKTVAKLILSACKDKYVSARIGGEEFIIVLQDIDKEEAIDFAERLRKNVEEVIIQDVNVTISLGLTFLKEDDTTELFFSRADKALYEAKDNGKNCIVVYDK